jgi:hypothetical protein
MAALRRGRPTGISNSAHSGPERGCVVSTSRSRLRQYQAALHIHALRLVLRTQPRSAKWELLHRDGQRWKRSDFRLHFSGFS